MLNAAAGRAAGLLHKTPPVVLLSLNSPHGVLVPAPYKPPCASRAKRPDGFTPEAVILDHWVAPVEVFRAMMVFTLATYREAPEGERATCCWVKGKPRVHKNVELLGPVAAGMAEK